MLISSYIRYKKVYRPVNVILMILAVWIVSFLILLPPLLGIWGSMGLDAETYSCTILKKEDKSPKKLLFLAGILPPFVIVLYCYTRILLSVRRSKDILRLVCPYFPHHPLSTHFMIDKWTNKIIYGFHSFHFFLILEIVSSPQEYRRLPRDVRRTTWDLLKPWY